ncbi:hypothetical protein NBRC116602_01550 [Hyphomicrobiales bacterium 4NK60-0047b]
MFVSGATAAEQKNAKSDDPKFKYNEVETLVFGLSHMDNVSYGQTVKYNFERKGVFGDDFKDTIELVVSKGEGENNKSVAFNFFSGKHSRPYPAFGFVETNPLLTLYFNKDAWDISRKIKAKGTANYLRNRIVNAIGKVKTLGKTVCQYNGVDHPAEIVSFEPYKGDESSHHLVHYALTKYELTLSKGIPGGLCKIKTVVPQHEGGVPDHIRQKIKKAGMIQLAEETELVTSLKDVKKPLLVEVLTFDSVRQTGVAKSD